MPNKTISVSHSGVIGMKWGVRREERRMRKEATKDANKFAKAKMGYGEGAGTRRKLVKAELERKLKDPKYKKSFDDALEAVNFAAVARQARRDRAGRDVKNQANRSTKVIVKTLTGTTSLAAAYILYSQNKPVVDKFIQGFVQRLKK